MDIYHFNPQQPIIYHATRIRSMPREFEGSGEELKTRISRLDIFGLSFKTTVLIIKEIFWFVEPKLSYNLYSDRKPKFFRNIWVSGKQIKCPSYPYIHFFLIFFLLFFSYPYVLVQWRELKQWPRKFKLSETQSWFLAGKARESSRKRNLAFWNSFWMSFWREKTLMTSRPARSEFLSGSVHKNAVTRRFLQLVS